MDQSNEILQKLLDKNAITQVQNKWIIKNPESMIKILSYYLYKFGYDDLKRNTGKILLTRLEAMLQELRTKIYLGYHINLVHFVITHNNIDSKTKKPTTMIKIRYGALLQHGWKSKAIIPTKTGVKALIQNEYDKIKNKFNLDKNISMNETSLKQINDIHCNLSPYNMKIYSNQNKKKIRKQVKTSSKMKMFPHIYVQLLTIMQASLELGLKFSLHAYSNWVKTHNCTISPEIPFEPLDNQKNRSSNMNMDIETDTKMTTLSNKFQEIQITNQKI